MVPLGHYSIQGALEVKSDFGFEISDTIYLCPHVSLASNSLHELNKTEEKENFDPLTCVASEKEKRTRTPLNIDHLCR